MAEANNGVLVRAVSVAEIKPDLEKLRLYTQTKLELAGQLRIAREALTSLGRENGERQCGELVVKLAEDRFVLAVLGQFKRGKSSLMNAIIGRELLPTGVLPLTSAITVLKYGPTERLLVNRENSIYPEELPVSALIDYVTEKGNPANQKKVKTACVELPVPFLRRGIEFVDTPGVGSAITTNTATTYDFLPECDAVLFVTSVDTPMTSLELAFLNEIQEYVDKIFFVVNKTDLLVDHECSEVLGFVTETIRSQFGCEAVKIFPVSARLGLAARVTSDMVLYKQSGIKALEDALAAFLSEEKSSAFLAAVAYKALQVLNYEMEQNSFGEATLRSTTQKIDKEESTAVYRDPQAAVAAVTQVRAKLEMVYNDILAGRMTEIEEIEVPAAIMMQTESAIETNILSPAAPVEDIAADLRSKGCPVCKHIAKKAFDFFADWQYQISTKGRAQAEFAAELGFCPLHTWQLLAISSSHGASIGNARLAEHIAHLLREKADKSKKGKAVQQLIRDSRNCRVCKLLRQAEQQYIHRLAALLTEAKGRSQYHRSQGVCLRHLSILLDTVSTSGSHEFLISHSIKRFEEDAEDMRSYAMKREALRRGLLNRDEEEAYRRTVIRIAGERSVCVHWEEDGEIC